MALVYGFLFVMHEHWVRLMLHFDNWFDVLYIASLALYLLPILLYEVLVLKVYRRDSSGVDLQKPRPRSAARIAVKLYGFGMTLALLGFCYWLFPEYDKDLYNHFFRLAEWLLPWFAPLIALYFIWMDAHVREPQDEYWQMGQLCLGNWDRLDRTKLGHHARAWTIKGFFLPMMAHYLYANYEAVLYFSPQEDNFFRIFEILLVLVYIADLVPVVVGYAFNMKLCDNHIRSADPTVKGWLVCLVCYAPIWPVLVYGSYLPYMDGENWTHWLGDSDFKWLWAGLILGSLTIYSSATVCFGSRWSNLTYRGLMASGPYRITKHPAYLFKNLSWWLITVPFLVDSDMALALKQFFMLLIVNYIYYLRAVTEEKHLSQFPEYRAYAEWMNEHSYTRWMHRLIPALKYDAKKYGY